MYVIKTNCIHQNISCSRKFLSCVSRHASKVYSHRTSTSFPQVVYESRYAFQERTLPANSTIFNLNIAFEPFYRVILIYTNWTDDKDVALRVTQAVPIVKFKVALQIVRNASSYGSAIIATVTKDDALAYVKSLTFKGLEAVVEEA